MVAEKQREEVEKYQETMDRASEARDRLSEKRRDKGGPYGPLETLSDLYVDKDLRELLMAGGLEPVDISEVLAYACETTLEISHPREDVFFAIEGITSRHYDGDLMIKDMAINHSSVMRNVDASAFNLGHLVPNALGVISRLHPLHMTVLPTPGSTGGCMKVAITLWGRTASASASPLTGFVGRMNLPFAPGCPGLEGPPRDPERGETENQRLLRERNEWRDKYLARNQGRQSVWIDGWEACLRAGQGQQRRSLRDRMMEKVFGTALPEEGE